MEQPVGGHFEIRLIGHLDASWVEWFDALSLEACSDGASRLVVALPDQAALIGLLNMLNALGVQIISIKTTMD